MKELGNVYKVHHKQLKAWVDPPQYLAKYAINDKVDCENGLQNNKQSSESSSDCFGGIYLETEDTDEESISEVESIYENCMRNRSNISGASEGNSRSITCEEREGLVEQKCNSNISCEKISSVALQDLHCSEPMNETFVSRGSLDSLVNREVSISKVGEVNEIVKNMICSTPNVGKDRINRDIDLSSIIQCLSSQEILTVVSKINENNNDFLFSIDKTLSAQENLIGMAVDSVGGLDTAVDDREITNDDFVGFPIIEEESFSGFGEEVPNRRTSAKFEALKLVRKHLGNIRDSISSYKSGNNNFIREIWKDKYMCSASQFSSNSNIDEISSIMAEVPRRLTYSSTPARITRSQGQVIDLPNVQKNTLEFKVRKLLKK